MKPKRNLWPFGIILTFVLFLTGTIGLVVMACSQSVDLVSSNYYEQELKFQNHIDRLQRTRALAGSAVVAYDPLTNRITISLPPSPLHADLAGTVQLYRPSSAGLDLEIALKVDANGVQSVDASSLRRGLWKVRVSWSANGQEYFLDQKIVIGAT